MAIPYYITGTATLTVGSATMTGQGTLWQGWVRVGDVVFPREGTPNVVAAVVSNSEITLLLPYRGTAQAAQSYIIMRTPDDVFTQTLAREVLQKVNDSSLAALAGLQPTARQGIRFDANAIAELFTLSDYAMAFLDDPSAAAMRATLGLDVNGQSNAPIRIRNANNAVEFGHSNASGFGSTLGAEVNSGNPFLLFFGEAGTLANTYRTRGIPGIGIRGRNTDGGLDFFRVPTANADNQASTTVASLDADGSFRQNGNKIVARGSNANGDFVRYADGTQLCYGRSSTSDTTNTADSNIFRSASPRSFTFPAAFISAPVAIPIADKSAGGGGVNWASLGASVPTNTGLSIYILGTYSSSVATAAYIAIGRWF